LEPEKKLFIMKKIVLFLAACLCGSMLMSQTVNHPSLFKDLSFRNIGPTRGGRVTEKPGRDLYLRYDQLRVLFDKLKMEYQSLK
jgi:hypothetical protein